MKSAVHRWLSNRWAFNTSNAYWRTLPMLSMGKVLARGVYQLVRGRFRYRSAVGQISILRSRFLLAIYFGTLGTALFTARMGRTVLVPVLLLIAGAGLWLAARISFHSSASPDLEAMHRRVVFDAIGMLLGTFVGYRVLVDFIRTEGLATVRIQTELAAFVFAPVAGQTRSLNWNQRVPSRMLPDQ